MDAHGNQARVFVDEARLRAEENRSALLGGGFEALGPFGVGRGDACDAVGLDDIPTFMSQLQRGFTATPQRVACLSHVIPVTTTFSFQTAQEFEDKAKKAVQQWLPQLIARSFHIRMHRRGFKGRLSSQHEEQFLDGYILDCLRQEGATAKVSFDDPDLIIVVETVGQQAGLALWTKEDRDRYGFLKLF